MGRKKQKVPTPLAALLAIAVSVTAMPLRQVVDPKYVDTNSFTHVDLPDSGAVKQYPTNSGHFHRRGKFHISLRYKPNLKIKKWQTRKNLCRLEDALGLSKAGGRLSAVPARCRGVKRSASPLAAHC